MQRADDAGRQVRKVWVGKPFDWTFGEWGLAFATTVVSLILLAFVLPSAVIALGGAWWAARWVSRSQAPDAPRRWFWSVLGALTVFLALLRPDVVGWLLPIPLLLTPFVAAAVGYRTTKRVGRALNWNRPLAYWLRLPGRLARGPRVRETRPLDPTALVLEAIGPDIDRADLDVKPISAGKVLDEFRHDRVGTLSPEVLGRLTGREIVVATNANDPAPIPYINLDALTDEASKSEPKYRSAILDSWYRTVQVPLPPNHQAMLEEFRRASEVTWLAEANPAEPFRVAGYKPRGGPEVGRSVPPPLPKAKWFTRLDGGDWYVRTPTRFLPDYRIRIGGHR